MNTSESWTLKLKPDFYKAGHSGPAGDGIQRQYRYVYCKPTFGQSALDGVNWALEGPDTPDLLFFNAALHWEGAVHSVMPHNDYKNPLFRCGVWGVTACPGV